MAELFGVDISELIAEAIASAGGLTASTLTKAGTITRDPANPARTLQPTTTSHTLEAVVEAKTVRVGESAIPETRYIATLIAGSITPETIPEPNDQLSLDGRTYTLGRLISRDPASATYQFEVS